MNTHNVCFKGKIRKVAEIFGFKSPYLELWHIFRNWWFISIILGTFGTHVALLRHDINFRVLFSLGSDNLENRVPLQLVLEGRILILTGMTPVKAVNRLVNLKTRLKSHVFCITKTCLYNFDPLNPTFI